MFPLMWVTDQLSSCWDNIRPCKEIMHFHAWM